MLKNYFKIAWRNIIRSKGYTFINIIGLGLGIACVLFIALWVWDELNYDRFHEKSGQIYRVAINATIPNAPPDQFAISNWVPVPTLQTEYPELESLTRLAPWNPGILHDREYFFNDDVLFADSTFFDVFTFPLVEGDPDFALRDPFTLVMTREMEQKYFGTESGLGRTLVFSDTLSLTVTGIISDVSLNSHFTYDFLVSWSSFESLQPQTDQYTYIVLKENESSGALEEKISGLIMQTSREQLGGRGVHAEPVLQPLEKIYLHSDRSLEIGQTGDIRYIYLFTVIGLFVLLIACINFMNLSTARSMKRAKEAGVRKVIGSSQSELVRQFLSEHVLFAFLALFIAAVIISAALPFFNDITSKEILFPTLLTPLPILSMIVLTLLVGLLAGSYPAFVLSRLKPVEVLKGSFTSTGKGIRLRQGLVIFQFVISVVMIIGTLVVFQQLKYMQHQDLGFDKEQVVVLDAAGIPDQKMAQQYQTVKQEFRQHPSVQEVSASNLIPGRGTWVAIVTAEGLTEDDSRRMQVVVTDHDFLKTMGIELAAGRGFSAEFETDEREAVLLNEAAVENFGWHSPDEALGKYIRMGEQRLTVVGVTKNYHHQSLRQKIDPMIIRIIPSTFNYFSTRFTTNNTPALLSHLESTWKRIFPDLPFNYFFLDDDFNKQYQTEQYLTRLLGLFSFLAIFIACLGLLGLAAFTAELRTKEIGIRKVMGASITGIVTLLSKDFLKLVFTGFVIAIPIAWYAMSQWLADFAYRIEIGLGIFALAGGAALVIALLTVSWQSVKAAVANPIESLRSE